VSDVDRLRTYLDHWNTHVRQLRSYANVRRVDVGYRHVGGLPTSEVAVRLFIDGRKRSHGANLAPRNVGPLPIDVHETAYQRHCVNGNPPEASRLHAPKLTGGLSVGTRGNGAVTLGVVVQSEQYPGDLALTAMHVGFVDDRVSQPSPQDSTVATEIGTIVDAGESAALVQLDGLDASVGEIMGLARLSGCVSAEELQQMWSTGARVQKSGRTTGVTSGTIDGIGGDGTVTLRASAAGRDLACGGDSGSIWVTPDGRGVALHYGGDDTAGFAQALYRIVGHFQLRVPVT
jgi:hypothetical protein